MLSHLVRIELHERFAGERIGEDVYARLHEVMEAARYYRRIRGASGEVWSLPRATYQCETIVEVDAQTVRDRVEQVVAAVWPKSSILVARFHDVAWVGLERS